MPAAFTMTGFGDEIDAELDEQLAVLRGEGIGHLELRAAWGRNVLDLDDEQVARARGLLEAASVQVSAIGSPIGKVPISDDFEAHRARFGRALTVAGALEVGYVRIFSFFMPAAEAPRHRDEVLRRLTVLADDARRAGVTLLHENEREIYGDTPERCLDLIESVGSPNLRATFDPANFVVVGVRPYEEAYPLLREHIAYWHVKDAHIDGSICVAGDGDAQWPELLEAEAVRGFTGFASLEPHLAHGGRFAGFSGPERFREAAAAFRRMATSIEGVSLA